ncbi:MAG TPA: endonuclease/exonuclease/phosphatase family protein, partial [Pseudorhizobium sp.]|nr:endonuclease/exonuclease/phosphatase family protein [Pseudorhizobium sp.]
MRDFLSVAICVIVSLILLALASRYVSGIWIFATLHSLQFHLSLASALALLCTLVLKRAFLPLGLLLLALALLGHSIWMSRDMVQSAEAAQPGDRVLKLMSFNILTSNSQNASAIAELILASGSDVVNIMEAEPLAAHLEALSAVYPYRIGCGEMTRECDLMMLSKLPFAERTTKSLSHVFEERMMVAELPFNGRSLHVAAIHTTKPYFDNFQSLELENAAELLGALDGPLVVSGDFNASSLAPNMRRFLRATGLRSGRHEPATWPVRA